MSSASRKIIWIGNESDSSLYVFLKQLLNNKVPFHIQGAAKTSHYSIVSKQLPSSISRRHVLCQDFDLQIKQGMLGNITQGWVQSSSLDGCRNVLLCFPCLCAVQFTTWGLAQHSRVELQGHLIRPASTAVLEQLKIFFPLTGVWITHKHTHSTLGCHMEQGKRLGVAGITSRLVPGVILPGHFLHSNSSTKHTKGILR